MTHKQVDTLQRETNDCLKRHDLYSLFQVTLLFPSMCITVNCDTLDEMKMHVRLRREPKKKKIHVICYMTELSFFRLIGLFNVTNILQYTETNMKTAGKCNYLEQKYII